MVLDGGETGPSLFFSFPPPGSKLTLSSHSADSMMLPPPPPPKRQRQAMYRFNEGFSNAVRVTKRVSDFLV